MHCSVYCEVIYIIFTTLQETIVIFFALIFWMLIPRIP